MDGTSPAHRPTRTTCPYCGVGCGVLARPDGLGGAGIEGDAEHPANFGRLCSKGSALGETLGLDDRLLYPEMGGARVSWDEALRAVTHGLRGVIARHGPEAVAFYLSGQLLTEDYYVANKLAKGFIGTPHVDTNSRLCMASSVAGHKRAFGADVVPQTYEDLELADLVVLVGSNAAWCHPVLYQRIQKVREERGSQVVNIDPRRTATSQGVDMHLAIAPGTDSILWNGLLVWLSDHGALDEAYIAAHTEGFETALADAILQAPSIEAVAAATELPVADVERFFRLWAGAPRVVTCYSQGVNQSAQGTDKVNAIINCHLAAGRIGKPGAGPLSLTGQPNAMGGREVGGLANMLAAHMGFTDAERDIVGRFWQAPNLVTGEGKKAVAMFEAIARGEIKALWVIGTNPAVSLPDADRARAALGNLELFIVSENVASNDTVNLAPIRLPAAAWGEKDGTVTNSERRISRQRAFLPLPGEARPNWWVLSEVAARLGWGAAFSYRTPADIFREHAALSGFENHGDRAFDISAWAGISEPEYDALAPFHWPYPAGGKPVERMFAQGGFFGPSRKARFLATAPAALARATDASWPFLLNTGRIRDQWHTMTRTGKSPRLSTHIAEPYLELHPDDAAPLGLTENTLAKVETAYGMAVLRVRLSAGQYRGMAFAPIHWSAENSSAGRIGALVHPIVDPISGQPEAKATPARIVAFPVAQYGVILSRTKPALSGMAYWAAARMAEGWVTFFAGEEPARSWPIWAEATFGAGETVTVEDGALNMFRLALLREGRLEAVLLAGKEPHTPPLDWLKASFQQPLIPPPDRRALLAGGRGSGGADHGPIVCVCFQVGVHRIREAMAAGAATSQEIGKLLRAGTNCGSCLPEIRGLLSAQSRQNAAAAAE
jgi:assimilatory nitrate reductase catalytic subunit